MKIMVSPEIYDKIKRFSVNNKCSDLAHLTPHQEGTRSLPAGGFVSQGFRHSPPHQEGIGSLPAGGFASRARARGSRRPPTRQEGYLPPREVALVHGGHNPITPQSKTISLPPARRPAPSSIFLTEVTSMGGGSLETVLYLKKKIIYRRTFWGRGVVQNTLYM